MTAYETIMVEKSDDLVATVTLNRPERLNSYNIAVLNDFKAFWEEAGKDDAINAVVLRACEGRAFSTGQDVREEAGILRSDNIWFQECPGHSLSPKRNRFWKPVITAVHGMAAGGAFYWLNESDIIICSEDATFFDPHCTFGLVAALEPIGATYRMPLGDVLRMALLGNDERISAYSALRMGLVTEVVPKSELWTRAHELAAKIARKPPMAIQGTIRAIWESLDLPREAALDRGLSYTHIGNPIARTQVDRDKILSGKQQFTIR